MLLLLLALLIGYWWFIWLLLRGLNRARTNDSLDPHHRPFVTVVIPARNEEANITACLESLRDQSYPRERYEIILIDDNSTDKTQELARIVQRSCPNLHIMTCEESAVLTGRSNALAQGIDISKGELILMTDADCTVKPTWVEYVAARFADPSLGILGAMTVQRAETCLQGAQSLDWAYLLGISCATIGLMKPISIIGNNFSVRRTAYDEVGGFRSIKNSVTEDFQLFQAIVRKGTYRYHFALDGRITNLTIPCTGIADIVNQKHRWAVGGLDLDNLGYLLIGTGFLTHAAIVGACVAGSWGLALAAFAVKTAGDWAYLNRILKNIDETGLSRFLPCFFIYYFFYVLAIPLAVIGTRKVTWKGRTYGQLAA